MATVNTHVITGPTCDACGQCCGGTCGRVFLSCRAACYPCCEDSVQFLPNLNLEMATPIAKQKLTGKYGKYDPNATDGLQVPLGITKHPVKTDSNGRLINFVNMLSFVPGCGQYVGVIYTSGEYTEQEIAQGDETLISALLSYPGFAKRIANGYIRIL